MTLARIGQTPSDDMAFKIEDLVANYIELESWSVDKLTRETTQKNSRGSVEVGRTGSCACEADEAQVCAISTHSIDVATLLEAGAMIKHCWYEIRLGNVRISAIHHKRLIHLN